MSVESNVKKALKNLSKRNICFVSEKHLQVEFAIEAEKVFNKCNIYPEYVFPHDKSKHIDLIIEIDNDKIAFEFKYIVCSFECKINSMEIELRQQSALPVRRYNCMKDISRLEKLKENNRIKEGYFILISNEKNIWIKSKTKTIDDDFKLDKGKICEGLKKWSNNTGKGTKKNNEAPIKINNNYKYVFEVFKEYKEGKNRLFKQLVLKI